MFMHMQAQLLTNDKKQRKEKRGMTAAGVSHMSLDEKGIWLSKGKMHLTAVYNAHTMAL